MLTLLFKQAEVNLRQENGGKRVKIKVNEIEAEAVGRKHS